MDVSNRSAKALAAPRKSRFWKRRGVVATSIILSVLSAAICATPFVLTATSMRNILLNSSIGNEEMTATVESATGGWFAPLVFYNVHVADAEGQVVWTVQEFRTTKGLLSFITDPNHIGEVRLLGSSLKVNLNAEGKWPFKSGVKRSRSELSFRIEDGSLELSVTGRAIPIIDLSNLTVTGNIGPDADGLRNLNIDPVHVLDHEAISESHTQQNLALIAPVLSQATALSGSVSVWLNEMHIPLDTNAASDLNSEIYPTEQVETANSPIHGRAEFHALEARLKKSWTRQLTALLGEVSGTAVPDRILVLKDSTVQFSASKDGIEHDGLVFFLPQLAQELTITSSGVVRLDETLDMLLTLKMPNIVPAGRPFMLLVSQLLAEPIQFRVVGTISEPKVQLPEGTNLLGELSRRIAPAQYTEESPPLPLAVQDLIQNVSGEDREEVKQKLPGSILNLIRAVDEQAKQKRAERKPRRK